MVGFMEMDGRKDGWTDGRIWTDGHDRTSLSVISVSARVVQHVFWPQMLESCQSLGEDFGHIFQFRQYMEETVWLNF